MEDFAEIVAGFGLKFRPESAQPIEFQKFISSIEGRPEERMLSYLMLRSFKQAMYSAENIGHFGLASDAYTHFTSPIRRYPDLVVHRILKAAMATTGPASLSTRPARSHRQRVQRTRADRGPSRTRTLRMEEDDSDGTASRRDIRRRSSLRVWKDGFAVELIDQFIEGFVPVADIPDDHYQLDPSDRARSVGRNGEAAIPAWRSAARSRLLEWTSFCGAPISCRFESKATRNCRARLHA